MLTRRSREGELMVDHRASPGLPDDFYAKIGLAGPSFNGRGLAEMPTMTCCHCNAVVVLNPQRTRERGHCWKCNDYVCDNPACNHACKPFSAVLDEAEKSAYRAQQRLLLP
jgi:hypothetical protein